MSFQENIPAAHIPRPPNPFICFRSRFIRDQKAASEKGARMQSISRRAGDLWNEMSDEQRRPYIEMSLRMKEDHMLAYPDYKFAPGKRAKDRPKPAPRHRPRATASGSQRRREHEPSPSPIPTLSSPYTPPDSQGQLYLPPDISSAEARSGKSVSPYARSDRSESLPDRNPPQFGTPDVPRGFSPQEFLSYYHSTSTPSPPQTQAYNNFREATPEPRQVFEQPQDFGSLCQWDHDFLRSSPARASHGSYYRPY
ncbi:high mobility group box domain-containing protein [Mycena latifolia]|nr:high mobility group box domain-containing protein [Mycena latifolia]